jgi:hypothetical protein
LCLIPLLAKEGLGEVICLLPPLIHKGGLACPVPESDDWYRGVILKIDYFSLLYSTIFPFNLKPRCLIPLLSPFDFAQGDPELAEWVKGGAGLPCTGI